MMAALNIIGRSRWLPGFFLMWMLAFCVMPNSAVAADGSPPPNVLEAVDTGDYSEVAPEIEALVGTFADTASTLAKAEKVVSEGDKVARAFNYQHVSQALEKAVAKSKVLKTIIRYPKAFNTIIAGIQAGPKVTRAYERAGVGGMVAEALYQATRTSAQMAAAIYGTAAGTTGTSWTGPGGFVGGFLGGYAAGEAAGAAIDTVFLDEVEFAWGHLLFKGSGYEAPSSSG